MSAHLKRSPSDSQDPDVKGGRIGIDESGKGDYFGPLVIAAVYVNAESEPDLRLMEVDRKSTRLNSSHSQISYAVFCWKTTTRPRLICGTRASAISNLPTPDSPINAGLFFVHGLQFSTSLSSFASCPTAASTSLRHATS